MFLSSNPKTFNVLNFRMGTPLRKTSFVNSLSEARRMFGPDDL
jgi:hypothetical protein